MPLSFVKARREPPASSDADVSRSDLRTLILLREHSNRISLAPRIVRATRGGTHVAAFKGRGMEFAESRPYQPGDDVRTLDWRVTARTGRPHTKLFNEERERPVYLWVDLRRGMQFATRGRFKAVSATQAAALVAWAAERQGDRVGGLVFTEDWHHEFKPRRGKVGVLQILNRLAEPPRADRRTLDEEREAVRHGLARLNRLVHPGSLVVMVSDFSRMDGEAQLVARLARHNDVMLIFVHDPFEATLPRAGTLPLTDGSRRAGLNTAEPGARERYRSQFQQRLQTLERWAAIHQAHLVSCSTADPPLQTLTRALGTGSAP